MNLRYDFLKFYKNMISDMIECNYFCSEGKNININILYSEVFFFCKNIINSNNFLLLVLIKYQIKY